MDAETGERGFLITGDSGYLEPYTRGRDAIAAGIAQVRDLTADNRDQQIDIERLSRTTRAKLGELASAIQQRRDSGFAAAQATVATDFGKRTMDDMRAIVARMEARENALLSIRSDQAARSYRAAQTTGIATTGLGLLIVLALFLGTRRFGAERRRAEQEAEHLRVTLESIGDAVVTTDEHGRVLRLNPIAEALTGWSEADAMGKRLEEVFAIVHEETRRPADNPIGRVLRERIVVGLANHTVLISKDGREIPIDDSAAPIRGADGRLVGAVMVFRDVTERRRVERERVRLIEAETMARTEAVAAEHRLRIALEAGRMGTWEFRMGAGTLKWSSGLEAIHGYPPGAFPGTFDAFEKEIHPEDHDRVLAAISAAIEHRRDHHIEYRIVRTDGTVRWVEGRGQLFCTASGQPDRMVGVCSDVTERKQAEDAERRAKREAEEANRMKDEFLAMVSHELRTPLSAVLGWADMLRSGTLPDSKRERALDAVCTNARRQSTLIDELLDVSRVMSGKLRLDRASIDLSALLRTAVDGVQPAADAKRIQIAVDAQEGIEPFHADSPRLQQILGNLLSNAVKFTPDGGVVRVRLRRIDNGIELLVADTGQGISREFLPLVFEPFRQGDGSITRRHGGLGLGLSIVKHLVEAHGGTVHAESPGQDLGSTFIVRLPAEPTHDRNGEPEERSQSELLVRADGAGTLRGISVLVVEDHDDSRDLMAAILEHHGASVHAAASAAHALELLQRTSIHVLLSDIAMPGEDGYTLIRRVRSLPGPIADVPAAAVTSLTREEDRNDALQAGFQRHLAKPIDEASLVEAVANLADGVRMS